MNEIVKEILGNSYSWNEELCYLGNPLNEANWTPWERAQMDLVGYIVKKRNILIGLND